MADQTLQRGSGRVWEYLWQCKKDADFLDETTFVGLCEEMKFRCFRGTLERVAGREVLECGCGPATMSVKLTQRGFLATMLDVSSAALSLARNSFGRHGLDGAFVQGDVCHLPFPDDCFDLVMDFGLLEHFSDPQDPIKEMIRVLRPSGVLLSDIIPKKLSAHTPITIINRAVLFANSLTKGHFRESLQFLLKWSPPFYTNNVTADEYITLMRRCGLREVTLRACHPFPDLVLPSALKRSYLSLLKHYSAIWIWLSVVESRIIRALARGWWVSGIKSEESSDLAVAKGKRDANRL